MDRKEKVIGLTINELLRYYVDRYRLPVYSSDPDLNDYDRRDFQALYKQMTRIIKNTVIGGESLWNIILPEQKGQARRISVSDFEKQCFPQWREYLWERYGKTKGDNSAALFDEGALLADNDRIARAYSDRMHWLEKARKSIDDHNRMLGMETFEEYEQIHEALRSGDYVSDEEVGRAALRMMVEALYGIFYSDFRWDRLKKDMEDAQYTLGGGGMATEDEVFPQARKEQAESRLGSYRNYVVAKKSVHGINMDSLMRTVCDKPSDNKDKNDGS